MLPVNKERGTELTVHVQTPARDVSISAIFAMMKPHDASQIIDYSRLYTNISFYRLVSLLFLKYFSRTSSKALGLTVLLSQFVGLSCWSRQL